MNPVGCVTSGQLSQMKISFVVKLFNCFNAMGRNVINKAEFAVHVFSTNSFFLSYFNMHGYHNYIVQFLITTVVGVTA